MRTGVAGLGLLLVAGLIAGCGGRSPTETQASAAAPEQASAAPAAVASAPAKLPIPREGLPDYVETREGGSYMTSMSGENAKRSTGMLMYGAPGPVADVIAFHRASMERHGMTVGEATTKPVRKYLETSFEGKTADGRSSLLVTIIDKSTPTIIVQLHYADEKS